MIVNQSNMDTLFRSFRVTFNEALTAAPVDVDRLSTPIPCQTTKQELPLGFLAMTMREWLGPRHVQNLAAWTMTVTPKHYEATIGVNRDTLEDDQYGIYDLAIKAMASEGARDPYDRLITMLASGGAAWSSTDTIDSVAFFSAAHTWAGGEYTTAQGNTVTTAFSEAAVWTALEAMRDYKNPNGKAMNIAPDTLLASTSLMSDAADVFNQPVQATGESNTLYGRIKPENQLFDGNLTTGYWMLLATGKPIKPFGHARRKPVELVAKTKLDDDNVFSLNEFQYGIDYRGCPLPLAWWLAYGSTGAG